MKRLVSGKGKYIAFAFSIVIFFGIVLVSFATVKQIAIQGGESYEVKTFSLHRIKETLASLTTPIPPPSATQSPNHGNARNAYPYTVERPPAGVKAVKNRFLASDNFPINEKTPLEDILLAVGDTACGYNKVKGLQCGGATSVFRDIKGVCWGTTPIPYDPCCGAPPQVDPRDPEPSCPTPACAGGPCGCFCAPPPFGCTPIPCSLKTRTNHAIRLQNGIPDCTQSSSLEACCEENPGAVGCTIEVHKECINGQCLAIPGPGPGDLQCQNAAEGASCDDGGDFGGGGAGREFGDDEDDEGDDGPEFQSGGCLPLACNCVCAARAGGGEFAWLWDSVTGFCGCNP